MTGKNRKRQDRDFFSYENSKQRKIFVEVIAKKFPDMNKGDIEKIVDCFYRMMKKHRPDKGRNRPDRSG